MARQGVIKSVRIGRLRRFPESAVNDYLKNHQENVIPFRPRVVPSEAETT